MATQKTPAAPRRRERWLSQLDTQLDWNAIAPEVALRLKGEPRTKSHTEWRWGSKGSFAIYLENGTFRDYEAGVSGGVIDMVSHCEGLDRQQAIQWLVDNNFLTQNNTATRPRPRPPIHKPKPAPKLSKKPHDPGNLEYGLRLWNESRPVPIDDNHPARWWSTALLASTAPVPDAIRFHRVRGFIVCCVATLANWFDAYPGTPVPEAAHAIAIDAHGRKRYPAEWNGDNKRTFGRVNGCGIFLIGDFLSPSLFAQLIGRLIAPIPPTSQKSSKVEAIEIHDLVPRSHEVTHK